MNAENQEKEHPLNVNQRTACARAQMAMHEQFEKCTSPQEVAMLFNYLDHRLKSQAMNKIFALTGQYVEVVSEESDAIQDTQPA